MSKKGIFNYYEMTDGKLAPVKVLTINTPKGNHLRLIDGPVGMQLELTLRGHGIGMDLSAEDTEWLKKNLVAS